MADTELWPPLVNKKQPPMVNNFCSPGFLHFQAHIPTIFWAYSDHVIKSGQLHVTGNSLSLLAKAMYLSLQTFSPLL